MKKFLLIVLVLVLAAAAALAIFIATFNVDRYRPLVVEQMQKALGRPVALQRISLGWQNGIAAQLDGLKIFESSQVSEPLLELESASANIKLLPLLHRDVRVTSIRLVRPLIRICRDAQGNINLLGLAAAASPAAASSQPISSGENPVKLDIGRVRIEQGSVRWSDALAKPVPSLAINDLDVILGHIALGEPMDVQVSAAVGANTKNVSFRGRILPPAAKAVGYVKEARLDIEKLEVTPFFPAAGQGAPKPRATLTMHVNVDVPALDPVQAALGATAQGKADLTDVAIENLNILRLVFDKISMLPGLVQRLESRLPPEYLRKLQANETVFAPITLPIELRSGRMTFDSLNLKTDTVRLSLQGQVGVIDQSVAMQGRLYIDPTLSKAILESVKELSALANASGEIEIPLMIQGRSPQLAVFPDLQYIASKVALTTAVDALSRWLAPKSETVPQESGSQASPPGQQTAPTTDELIGSLLQRALKKHKPAESTPQPPQ